MSTECERARQWASIELDGELSSFEGVLLRAHLSGCASCREFSSAIGGVTHSLRAAPLERLGQPIEITRPRRRLRLRLAPAVAAMAVAAVGLGSLLASSAVRSNSVANQRTHLRGEAAAVAALDTMNVRNSSALERLNAFQQIRISQAQRSLRGGPVLQER
jgi:predicted anti-sigma-YlaC factor YlaD